MKFLLMSLMSMLCVYLSLVGVYKPLLVGQNNNTYNGFVATIFVIFFTKKKKCTFKRILKLLTRKTFLEHAIAENSIPQVL